MIAFVGAVFSPAYFRTRRRGLRADPLAHCGFNVVVHAPGGDRWALAEYRGTEVVRERDVLAIGRNRIERDSGGLTLHIDERSTPWRAPIRGRVRLEAPAWQPREIALDVDARHVWWPVAPSASIEVELQQPDLRFRGVGYHDANAGCEALEQAFSGWSWARGSDALGTALLYDVVDRDGGVRELGLHCDPDGTLRPIEAPAVHRLADTRWRLPRHTRSDAGGATRLRRTLVDAPFYARSWIDTELDGRALTAMHEVVDLHRFARTTTQWMLPFRTRGVGWR